MFIVKVPGINGENSEGCQRAGNAVLKELREIYCNEQKTLVNFDSLELEEIHLDNSNLKLTNDLIYENALETFQLKLASIFLGGDNSISYSILKAFLENCSQNKTKPCLIVFSANGNCQEISEFATNKNWLSKLVESGFPSENILLVGVRNFQKEELKFLKKHSIKNIPAASIVEDLHEICDTIMEFSNGKELYVSIDFSIIDPAFAPSVISSQPGGMTSREFLYIIQRLKKVKNLRAVDLVEINEKQDLDKKTVKLGAKVLSELI